ncbi:Ig-like domain-containing protein [Roseixanthobacter glucoisosaccharinicivorans]|uniref:Ig-like domain-containing protein n=1 Tax=Roseixanthobacter glucoisosaccharinicivorans TaxID=3119923 RepID=UPI00372B6E45
MASTYNPTRVIDLGTLGPGNGATIFGAAAGDYAGYSVSGAGDVNGDGIDDILVGAPRIGEAYIIFGRDGGLGTIDLAALDDDDATNDPGLKIIGAHGDDFAGASVSGAGDVNCDGVADFIIGVPYADRDADFDDNGGKAYVIFGKTAATGGLNQIDLSVFDGEAPVNATGIKISGVSGSLAGGSVSNAGDVNGDGIGDLIIGAVSAHPSKYTITESAYVIFGASEESGGLHNIDLEIFDGEDSENASGVKISGAKVGDLSGYTVSAAGDVNGDGVDDVIIGAPQANNLAGASYVIYGKSQADGGLANIDLAAFEDSDTSNDPGFKISGARSPDTAGYSVSGAGDVNGDGIDDLIIGAIGYGELGGAYVVYGKVGGVGNINLASLSSNRGFTISGVPESAYTGASVSEAGDVNGDGYDDVIVGAFYEGTSDYAAGASYVVYGRPNSPLIIDLSHLSPSQGFKIAGAHAGDQSGFAVSAAGDVNGDGFADVIVGAFGVDAGGGSDDTGAVLPAKVDAGAAYVVYGGAGSGSPTIASIASSSADGFYKAGDTLSITVTFSDLVSVNTTGGAPRLLLETGENDHYATYASGSGTDSLTFTYTIVAGDESADLSYAGVHALDLNGGRIVSPATGVPATLVLPAPGETGSLSASSDIRVGADPAPVVTLPDASAIDYAEQSGPISVFGDLDLTDADSTSLASATIVFANFSAGEDILAMTATSGIGNIAGGFDPDTGMLTLTSAGASATLAEWQAALRTITFENTSDTPDLAERTFTLVVSDGTHESSALARHIEVLAVNDAPVAENDAFSINEDTAATFNVLANDSDVDGTHLTIRAINGVAVNAAVKEEEKSADFAAKSSASASSHQVVPVDHGTVQVNPDGSLTFTPSSDFNGTTSFTYSVADEFGGTQTATVTVNVLPVNDAPEAKIYTISSLEDQALILDVAKDSTDADGDALLVTAVDGKIVTGDGVQVAGGVVTLNAQGALLFTPTVNYNGPVKFTYTLSDGHGGLSDGQVDITVSPVNDAPVIGADFFTIAESETIVLDLLANDSDPENDTLAIAKIIGMDVTPGGFEARWVGGTIVYRSDGKVTFSADADYTGDVSFTYTVSDSRGGESTGTVRGTVIAVNEAPVASDDTITGLEDSGIVVSVLENDKDAQGDLLRVVAIDGRTISRMAGSDGSIKASVEVANGTVTLNQDGVLVFTPKANFNGETSFTYTVSDGRGGSDTATVTLDVRPVNDAPTAQDVSFAVAAGVKSQRIDVGAGTRDIDGDLVRVLAVDGKEITANTPVALTSGTVSLAADGNLIFSPFATFSGTTSFSYTLTDDHGGTQSAQLKGEVHAVESWTSFGTELDKVLDDLGLSKPGNLNDLLAKATYLAPAAFATAGVGIGQGPLGGYHAAAGYDLDLNATTPDTGVLSKALAALINGQTYFNTPSVAKLGAQGAVTSSVNQSLLFQSYLKSGSQVHIDDGHGGQDFASAASAASAWSKAFAQSVLSAGFSDDQVTKYDHQSQAKLYQSVVGKDAALAVTLDGVSTAVSKAALALSGGEFVSDDGGSAVEIARPVAVAETAGGADDQNAVVRMRQVGANDSSVMFYKVDDFAGTVNGLKPGDAGYDAASSAHAYQTDTGSTWVSGGGYGKYSEATLTHINANDLIAMKLSSGGSTFYAFADANEIVNGQHVAHVWSYGLNTWGWEDLYGGGDNDFNDIVVQLDFLAVKTIQDQIL